MQKLYKALLFLTFSVFAGNWAFAQCTITGLNSSYCVDDSPVTLSGGTAYFGDGVSGGVFYPSIAGVSTRPHKIFTTDGTTSSYTVSTTGTFNPYTLSSPTNITVANNNYKLIPIGFNFSFFGTIYTNVYAFDNGFLKFTAAGSTSATAQSVPATTNPNNDIAFAWNDLVPSTGTIRYQLFGTAPLRVLVIEYLNVQFVGGADYVSVQIHLFESSNHIEIHSTHNGSIGVDKTMGIENNTGTAGIAVTGRNQSTWTADNDFAAFIPSCTTVKEVFVNSLPNAGLTVTPSAISICPANTVDVTIQSSVVGVNYQLLNNADNTSLSTVSAGNGSNIVLTSFAISSSVVIKVRAVDAITGCDVDLTNTIPVTVDVPPQITVQPADPVTACETQSVTFTVDAGATTTPFYQWRKDGSNIGSANSSSYTIASVIGGDAATYDVVISGTCTPPITSSGATLTVNTSPVITVQPVVSQSVCEGTAAGFSVTATGTGLTYQWKKNGIDIAGETASTYNTGATTTSSAGTYSVVVSGTCTPGVTSNASTLLINELPEITVQPISRTICEGATVSFSVTAGVTTAPTYSWKLNGVTTVVDGGVYSGASTSTLTLTNVPAGFNTNQYTVIVNGTCGSPVTSSPSATLTVNTSPVITVQPVVSQSVCEGTAAGFSVTATGTGLTYQWKKNGIDIAGETASTYNTGATTTSSAGTYSVVVSGTCTPGVTSNASTLLINELPEITVQPISRTICEGATVSFSVTAGVTTAPTYSWKLNGVTTVVDGGVYSGASTSTLTLTNVPAGFNTNQYTVIVNGTCGSPVTSSPSATLTVNTSPVITVQPVVSQSVCEGTAAGFSVTATGTGLTYQWKKNGIDIAGETASTYNTGATTTSSAGTYSVVVSGTCTPGVTSNASTLLINELPEITVQPISRTICAGATVSFSVTAGVTTAPTYSWKLNGVTTVVDGGVYSGASTSTLTLTNVPAGFNTNQYTVIVNGTCGSPVTSSPSATLTVNTSPVITVQPVVSQSVCEGTAAGFSVTATGTGLTYQWKKNGIDIAGETASTYNTGATTTSSAGTYSVVVSGTCTPGVTSNASTLLINELPEITVQPISRTICEGATVSFSVTAGVTTAPTYSWKLNGVTTVVDGGVYSGASTSTLTLTNVPAGFNTNQYTVIVNGTCGSPVTSSPSATLTVNTSPVITVQPVVSQSVCEGTAAGFSVTATGTGLTYQWKKNGIDIAGETASTYNTGATTTSSAGTYSVVVSGTCTPGVTSNASTLLINELPEITVQPISRTICEGATVSFSVTAGVTTAPTYSWKLNGVTTVVDGGVYSGASTSTLTLTNVPAGFNTNQYTVIVNGTCGSPVTSSPSATLTVNTSPVITVQPVVSQSVCEGTAAGFSVTATGTGLTYQWKKNGIDIAGETASTYNTGATTTSSAGTYSVVVSGTCTPGVTSNASTLLINELPEITVQPISRTICAGATVSFSVTAGVTTAPTYSWKLNGVTTVVDGGVYSGASTSTLTLTNVPAGFNTNQYTVIVNGTCGSPVTSSPSATLTVNTSPVITVQPVVSQSVCEGTAAGFSVTATGTGLTYQWKKNGIDIAGETASTYNTGATTTSSAGTYSVVVSGTCTPGVTSNASTLLINELPEITVQPISRTICEGATVSFSVTAGVTTAPTYSWKLNGVTTVVDGGVYSGASTSTLTLTNVPAGFNTNQYTVIVNGTCGSPVTSSPSATLTVNTSPVITVQPVVSQSVCEGTAAGFSVTATGTGLTYQWKKNGIDIAGETASTYNTGATTTSSAGTYSVVVSGTCTPGVTSNASTLLINELPEITVQPISRTICEGATVSFSVTAGVTTAPTYSWKLNGVTTVVDGGVYSGASTSTLTLTNVPAGFNTNQYTVIVNGTCGSPVTSSPSATLTVNTSPVITVQPVVSQSVCEGTAAGFSVTATGTGLTYQWKKNGIDIAGETASTYNTGATTTSSAGTYSVVVSGTCTPGVTSNASTLLINELPEITVQPISRTICEGATVSFSVTAGVTTAPTYSWKLNGVTTVVDGGVYSGASTSTLTLTNVPAGFNTNQYTVIVNGTCGSPVTSSPSATLTVNTSPVITVQPVVSQSVCEGTAAGFSVTATGTGLTYQWKKNGIDIAGETASTYNTGATTTSSAGTYSVVVSGTCTPGVTSNASTLLINELPEITVQPISRTICEGATVSFSVTAGVTTAPTYSWKLNGVTTVVDGGVYSGASTSTLTLTNVPAGFNTNQYTVIVNGTCGSPVTSSPSATLTVNTSPVITVQPVVSQSVCEGTAAGFSVTATGTGLTYQWKKNGIDIAGETASTYNTGATTTSSAGTYSVVVSGTCTPGVTSNASTLLINELPEITVQPISRTICEGATVSFSVTAGVTTAPTYSWKLNGVTTVVDGGVYSGASTSTLTLTNVPAGFNTNQYTVIVNGTCGSPVTSSPSATLTVNTSPVITVQPVVSQSVCEGTAAGFSVTATGTGLTYQWKKNGIDIAGETASTYNTGATTTSSAGTYSVVVSGTCAPGVTSNASTLLINELPEITVQPISRTICEGATVSFSVTAGVTTAPTYSWKLNGVTTVVDGGVYSGASTSTLTLTNVPAGFNTNQYTVIVNGTCGSPVTSSPSATLTVNTSPVITVQPVVSQSVCEGTAAGFSVTATGTGLTYQWKKNGIDIAGETASTYNTGATTTSSAGTYSVVVSGTCAPGVTSNASTLLINELPEITVQPISRTICEGATVSFSVTAGVTTAPTYSWKLNGVTTVVDGGVYSGASTSTLTLTNVPAGFNTNQYTVIVNGTCGSPVTSSPSATLTVNTSPVITVQPVVSQSVCEGTAAGFSVTATGTGLTYQWKKNGIDIAGETASTYNTGATTSASAGTYSVVVSGTCTPGVTSNASTLLINELPEITVQPISTQTLCEGEKATFSVDAGVTTVPTYQWRKNTVDIPTAINSTYTILNVAVSDAATYDVVINGTCNVPVTSTSSVLNVNVRPTSFANPQAICSGTLTNITITNPNSVSGTVFNWTVQSSSNVTGATSGSLSPIAQMLTSSDGVTQGTVTYQIVGTAASCDGPPFAVTVTVNSVPDALASDKTICSGTAPGIVISNPNGVVNTSFNWTVLSSSNVTGASGSSGTVINQVLTSSDGVSSGFVIYNIIPSANSCPGSPVTSRIDVTPMPAITTPSTSLSMQICSNVALNFTPSLNFGAATYTWTSTISGTISAASITAIGSGTISDTPVNTGNTTATVTYHITPHYLICDGLTVDYVVTVKPLPSATASNVVVCSGQNAVITISSAPQNVTGTTFSWTATPDLNVLGSSGGNGSLINQILSTTDAVVGNVTYTIMPTASGCSSILPVSVVAKVNPIATVDAGVDYSVCQPLTIILTGTIGGSATAATWSKVSGLGSVSGNTVTGNIITAIYTVAPGDISGSVILRLTTNDPDGPGIPGPCIAVSDDVKIDIHKKATVTVLPASYTVCEPTQITLSGGIGGSAVTGSWNLLSGAGSLTISSVTGSNVTATYFPTAADVTSTVKFQLTTNDPDGSGASGPCSTESADLSVVINESPKVNAGTDSEICEDKVIQLAGNFSGTATIVTWSGGSGTSQFSDIHDKAATYTLTAADIAAGSVTLTLTTDDPDGSGPAGPCNQASDQVKIIINKLPIPKIVGLLPIYAENDPIVALTGFSTNSSSGTGVFTGPGILAGTSNFDPSTSGTGVVTILYTFIDNKTCVGSVTASTIVNPVTSLEFDVADSTGSIFGKDNNGYPKVCANQGITVLIGTPSYNDTKHLGIPSFAAVPSTSPLASKLSYDPASKLWLIETNGLVSGNYTITYTYTNEFNATNTITKDIVVLSSPKAIIDVGNNCIDADVKFYESSDMIPENGSSGKITNWNWLYGEELNGSNGDSTYREPLYGYHNPGVHRVKLTVTTNQGCSNLAQKDITIGVRPKIDFSWSSFCQGDTTSFVNKSTSTFGNINRYAWDFKDGDTLGLASSMKVIPPGQHSGRSFGTWKDPKHTYQSFNAYKVLLTVGTDAGCIDTLSKRVVILDFSAPLATQAYFNDFESGSGTWFAVSNTSNDTLVSWSFGIPSGNLIKDAGSGDNAWWTGLNKGFLQDRSTYFKNENSYVVGPCLDISSLDRPMISLDYWADTQIGFDGTVVQYSLDGGTTWETIGDAQGAGINWYTQRDLLSQPGDQDNFAWSESDSGWKNARYNLDKIPQKDRGQVVIRLAFASNNDNPSGRVFDGFAFDNIYIGEKKRNVVIEHFANNDDLTDSKAIDQLFIDQTTIDPKKGESDFFKMEYHLDIPNDEDTISLTNMADSRTRAFYYGVSQPPFSIMDGISGQYFNTSFNGSVSAITTEEIDRRALEDPLFDIQIDTLPSSNKELNAEIRIKYIDTLNTLNNSIVVRAAIIEGNIGPLQNVVRKLLPSKSGQLIEGPWDSGRLEEVVPIDYKFDVHITNPDSLYLVVFVQNNAFDENPGTSRRIHQALKMKLKTLHGAVVTGLPGTQEINGLKIYPNPAKNTLYFVADRQLEKEHSWELVDQRGVSVLSGKLRQDLRTPQPVDISSVANGIYFVKVFTNKGTVVYKKLAVTNGY